MRQDWLQPNQAAGGFGTAQSINHTRKTQVLVVNLRGPGPSLWMLQTNNQHWTKLVTNTFPNRTIATLRHLAWTLFARIRQLHWPVVWTRADFKYEKKYKKNEWLTSQLVQHSSLILISAKEISLKNCIISNSPHSPTPSHSPTAPSKKKLKN